MKLTFRAIDEPTPGDRWAGLFRQLWPGYRRWWLSQGEDARPSYLTCRKAVAEHMPELLPVFDTLAELAGGSDHAARFLSCYDPPPYQAACSQAVWPGSEALLVRNYDYDPAAFDSIVLRTRWLGKRVLGVSDCLIGLLDGMNEDGLAVSLTFGGRRETGTGFGIPLVLRYVLETCASTAQAVDVLRRIPCHMAYNVTVLDRAGDVKTAFLGPKRDAVVTASPVATNHQHEVEPDDSARTRYSVTREAVLLAHLERHRVPSGRFISAFLRPPLYSPSFEHGFGTLYTAAYRPASGELELHWPGSRWPLSLTKFHAGAREIVYFMPAKPGEVFPSASG